MIKLTPIEIERHDFKVVWRGYDPDEVRAFLGQIAQQLTTLIREQEKAEEVLELKAQRLAQVEDYETRLRDALLAASSLAEQTREEARRESELLIREAEVKADQVLKDGRQTLQSIMSETQALKRQRERLSVELRSIVESHLRMLENQEEHLKVAQGKWKAEEEKWQEMATSLFTPSSSDQIPSNADDDALLEARELTLALGSSMTAEGLADSKAESSTLAQDPLLTPTIPEPLSNRPLSESRLNNKDKKSPSVKLTANATLPGLTAGQENGVSAENTNEHSGIARLHKVLSEVPRQMEPEDG